MNNPEQPVQKSYAPEIQTDDFPKWVGNRLRFESEAEAKAHLNDLAMRWSAVLGTRAVLSDDPVNYRYVNGELLRLADHRIAS
jgi:hypothetical protein